MYLGTHFLHQCMISIIISLSLVKFIEMKSFVKYILNLSIHDKYVLTAIMIAIIVSCYWFLKLIGINPQWAVHKVSSVKYNWRLSNALAHINVFLGLWILHISIQNQTRINANISVGMQHWSSHRNRLSYNKKTEQNSYQNNKIKVRSSDHLWSDLKKIIYTFYTFAVNISEKQGWSITSAYQWPF